MVAVLAHGGGWIGRLVLHRRSGQVPSVSIIISRLFQQAPFVCRIEAQKPLNLCLPSRVIVDQ